MSDHRPPGTPADDDQRMRPPSDPRGGARPSEDADATIIPDAPPRPNPPLYGSPPAQPSYPPAQPSPQPPPPGWGAPPADNPVGPTAPYPTAPPAYPGVGSPPPYGSGYAQPPPYGGTQPLPQPPATPPYGGYQQPPPYGGYGAPPAYPPSAGPPSKGKGGVALGIGGGVLALIAIVGGILLFKKGDSGTATSTPAAPTSVISSTTAVALATQAGGGNILATLSAAASGTARPAANATPTALAAAATPTAAPTRVAPTPTRAATTSPTPAASASRPATSPTVGQGGLPPIATGSARPGTAAATTSVALSQTWTDPNGRLKMRYPNGWTVTKLANSQSNIVEIDGPDGVSFYIDVFRQSGTPTEEIQATKDARDKSAQFAFTFSPITDTSVGGEAGKAISYTAKRKDQTTGAGTDGTLWIVNHGDTEYDFEALVIGRHRPEVEAILASAVFM